MSNRGKRCRIVYNGQFDDGTGLLIPTMQKMGQAMSIVCGGGEVVQGLDDAIDQMVPGETRTVHIAAIDAYGERDEALVKTVPLFKMPYARYLKPGTYNYLKYEGKHQEVFVVDVTDEAVTIDANNRLAGKSIDIQVSLIDVLD